MFVSFKYRCVVTNSVLAVNGLSTKWYHLMGFHCTSLYGNHLFKGGRFKKEVVLDGQSYLLLIRDEGSGVPEYQVRLALLIETSLVSYAILTNCYLLCYCLFVF